ncbi:MAG: isoamylase early set domain-containing protein [candidate division Zixibacteria bacterium]|nr:isoamylase early set domain-containing protein [candidate division Zixibacteria bacterium]
MYKRLESGQVKFVWPDSKAKRVFLVGDFNKWNEQSLPMRKKSARFELILKIPPGRHQFKYLIDGIWWNDPDADDYAGNFWGSEDSVICINRN